MWKNNTTCPHYIAPRHCVYTDPDSGIEYDYESAAMCDLVDKYCLMETEDYCETYEEFFKEQIKEDIQL